VLHRFYGMRLSSLLCVAVSSASLFASTVAAAAPESGDPSRSNGTHADYLFAERGQWSGTFATGMPFVAVGELAYGASDRFAIGGMAAATPDVGHIKGTITAGVRPRGVLFASGAWRSTLVVPILYYPQVKGFGDEEPWMLARPALSLERELPSGARLNAGVGLIAAACTESLLTLGKERTMMGGVWNTASIGGAAPVSARTSFFGEGSAILDGVVPAHHWIGGAPVVALAGVSSAF
jgi:hypothetical protein